MTFDDCDLFEYAARQQPVKKLNPSAARPLPVDVIREALEIDETVPSGLRWKVRPRHHFKTERAWKKSNTQYAGRPAGTRVKGTIYWNFEINGKAYLTHRVVFFLANGIDPGALQIDHIRSNLTLPNVASNLRLATHAENLRNQKKNTRNTSGVPGVYWDERKQKWCAQIKVNGKYIYLGLFTDLADAVAARKAAEVRYFGEFSYDASQNLKTA